MNQLGNVEKYVIGAVLGLISLLVIYGASASNRVASWVDGPASGRDDLVGLNNNDAQAQGDSSGSQRDSIAADGDLTPLEKAGQLPQRQTVIDANAEADDIRIQPLDTDTASQDPATTEASPASAANSTQPDPAPTVARPAQTTDAEPVRALW